MLSQRFCARRKACDGLLYFYPIERLGLAHGFNNKRLKIDIKRVKPAVSRAKLLKILGVPAAYLGPMPRQNLGARRDQPPSSSASGKRLVVRISCGRRSRDRAAKW